MTKFANYDVEYESVSKSRGRRQENTIRKLGNIECDPQSPPGV